MIDEAEVRELAAYLSKRVLDGELLLGAMRDVCLRHAERLSELGPVGALALDPCPACGGTVLASDDVAHCRRCGWSYRRQAA